MIQGKILEKVYNEINERIPIEPIVNKLSKKEVPVHKYSGWYYLGGICLFFFTVQVITGILLMLYYSPGEDSSYISIQKITNEMDFGWLIRSMHNWSANLMILAVVVHMFSVFFMKAYEKPRDLTWFSGLFLLMFSMIFGFSGYLLPWDELAFFATRVGVQIIDTVPFIGNDIANLIRGGTDLNGFTISRFFTLHVVILPLMFIPLLSLHLLLINIHPNKVPKSIEKQIEKTGEKQTVKFFWGFFLNDIAVWFFCLVGLILLSTLMPTEFGKEANILSPAPENIHPEWYFMALFQVLKWMPPSFIGIPGEVLGMVLPAIILVPLALAPIWPVKLRKYLVPFGITAFSLLVIFTIVAYIGVMA